MNVVFQLNYAVGNPGPAQTQRCGTFASASSSPTEHVTWGFRLVSSARRIKLRCPFLIGVTSIVFVPDVQSQASKTWLDASWAPLQRLIPTDVSPLILGFESSLGTDFESVWNAISSEAETLINCLIGKTDAVAVRASFWGAFICCRGSLNLVSRELDQLSCLFAKGLGDSR